MENKSIEQNKKKYIWLHRLHVSIFLFIIIRMICKLVNLPETNFITASVIIIFLIISVVEYSFIFNSGFYKITFLFTVPFVLTPTINTTRQHVKFEWLGDLLVILLFFVLLNSLFVLHKVFGIKITDLMSDRE